jgi:hypothetical protein
VSLRFFVVNEQSKERVMDVSFLDYLKIQEYWVIAYCIFSSHQSLATVGHANSNSLFHPIIAQTEKACRLQF